jgi:hypothetical protein
VFTTNFFFRLSYCVAIQNLLSQEHLRKKLREFALDTQILEGRDDFSQKKKFTWLEGGECMTLEEQKRRIETMRRKFRAIHREMMEHAERINKRLEPNHRHPEKPFGCRSTRYSQVYACG